MIVSWENKYIFVAIHHTASTVIEKELCNHYGGVKVRHKHSLPVFLPSSVRDFRLIGGVRNPVTDVVAQYNKYANDHLGIYSAQIEGRAEHTFMSDKAKSYFTRIQDGTLSLEKFLMEVGGIPQVPRVELNNTAYSYIYRMENMAEEFRNIITHCNLELVRDLPLGNPTAYQRDPEIIDRFLKHPGYRSAAIRFGYTEGPVSLSEAIKYRITKTAKSAVWGARELKSIARNNGFYEMKSAVINKIPEQV